MPLLLVRDGESSTELVSQVRTQAEDESVLDPGDAIASVRHVFALELQNTRVYLWETKFNVAGGLSSGTLNA